MFDVDAMVAVASNQVEAVQDELWLLQTDPSYLNDQAKLLRDTWIDNLPSVKKWSDEDKYCRITEALIYRRFG